MPAKFTRGPWIAHVSMVDELSGNDIMLIRSQDPLRGIASIELESEEDEANAQLMSLAPELLLACEGALVALTLGEHVNRTQAIDYLTEVIAKSQLRGKFSNPETERK